MQTSKEPQNLLKGILKNPAVTFGERNENNCQSKSRLSYNLFDSDGSTNDARTMDLLTKKFKEVTTNMKSEEYDDSDDSFEETIEEKEKRKRFERLRRNYYSEYKFVKIARVLIDEEINGGFEDQFN